MKKYFKYMLYIIGGLLLMSLIVTILHYFNIINDNLTNILLSLFSLILFLIFPNKYSNRNRKETIKIAFPLIILFFIISLFKNGFELKNIIYFIFLIFSTLLPTYLKKEIEN